MIPYDVPRWGEWKILLEGDSSDSRLKVRYLRNGYGDIIDCEVKYA